MYGLNFDGTITVRPAIVAVTPDSNGMWKVAFLTITHREIVATAGLSREKALEIATQSGVSMMDTGTKE